MISIKTQQVLIPKSVYIGDSAELRCNFKFSSDYLEFLTQNNKINLSEQGFLQGLNYEEYEIQEVTLYRTGEDFYTLSIIFIPWKTGFIKFPDFCINQEENLQIAFEKLEVKSLISEKNILQARTNLGPLLLPGTVYKFYGSLLALVMLLIIAIRLFTKRKAISEFVNKYKRRRLLKRLKRNLIREFKKLLKLTIPTENIKGICMHIQKLLRNYLQQRFNQSFLQYTTTEIQNELQKISCEQENYIPVFEIINSIFLKTDYFRYTKTLDDVEEEKNMKIEIQQLIEKCIAQIEGIDEV